MKRIFGILSLMLLTIFGLQSCDDDSSVVGGGIDPEPD